MVFVAFLPTSFKPFFLLFFNSQNCMNKKTSLGTCGSSFKPLFLKSEKYALLSRRVLYNFCGFFHLIENCNFFSSCKLHEVNDVLKHMQSRF